MLGSEFLKYFCHIPQGMTILHRSSENDHSGPHHHAIHLHLLLINLCLTFWTFPILWLSCCVIQHTTFGLWSIPANVPYRHNLCFIISIWLFDNWSMPELLDNVWFINSQQEYTYFVYFIVSILQWNVYISAQIIWHFSHWLYTVTVWLGVDMNNYNGTLLAKTNRTEAECFDSCTVVISGMFKMGSRMGQYRMKVTTNMHGMPIYSIHSLLVSSVLVLLHFASCLDHLSKSTPLFWMCHWWEQLYSY